MIAVTTGRNPTQSTRRLCKELASSLPQAYRLVRGKLSLPQLTDKLAASQSSRLIIVYRGFGGPRRLELMKLEDDHLRRIPPSIILRNVRFTSTSKRRRAARAECITANTDAAIRLGEALSDFLELQLVDNEKAPCTHSLDISRDPYGGLRLAPINLSTRNVEGFVVYVKTLRW